MHWLWSILLKGLPVETLQNAAPAPSSIYAFSRAGGPGIGIELRVAGGPGIGVKLRVAGGPGIGVKLRVRRSSIFEGRGF